MILQARCNRGHGPCRINFEYPDGLEQVPVYYACGRNPCEKDHQHIGVFVHPSNRQVNAVYQGTNRIKEAGPYLLSCVAHKQMMYFRKLKTSRSSDMCSPDCELAEGDKCKCSCGGMNHGVGH